MKSLSKFRFSCDAYVNGEYNGIATHIANVYTTGERLTVAQGLKAIEKGLRAYIAEESEKTIAAHVYIYGKCAGIITAQKNGRRVDFARDLYNLDWAIAE